MEEEAERVFSGECDLSSGDNISRISCSSRGALQSGTGYVTPGGGDLREGCSLRYFPGQPEDATPWVLKAVNIKLLADQVDHGKSEHILHIAALICPT